MSNERIVDIVNRIRFVEYIYKQESKWTEHKNIPFLCWPDGTPNNYANLYLLYLIEKKFSTTGRGGTIRQYAYVIGRYIAFCYANRVGLLELSNAQVSLFVSTLRVSSSGKANSETTVITNVKIIFDFVHHIETLQGISVVEGRFGATRKLTTYVHNGRRFTVQTWSHPSFGEPSPKKHRSAIETGTIDALIVAAETSSADEYIVTRRQMLIKVLEVTGARIGECSNIAVVDIEAAREDLMLKLITLKRRKPHTRELPILRQDLADIEKFLILRKIAKRGVKTKDDGLLFFSKESGRGMSTAALGNEIGILRRLAGITEQASAHLFRHRFITKIIIHLIEAHEFESPQHMRRALQEIESLKKIVCEWTGHASLSSLENYIDTAFSEWKGMRKSVDKAFSRRASDAFESKMVELANRLGTTLTIEEFRREFSSLKANLDSDRGRHIILTPVL